MNCKLPEVRAETGAGLSMKETVYDRSNAF
jgi:hypothetical protein